MATPPPAARAPLSGFWDFLIGGQPIRIPTGYDGAGGAPLRVSFGDESVVGEWNAATKVFEITGMIGPTGPTGPQGPTGATGPTGSAGTARPLFAQVTTDETTSSALASWVDLLSMSYTNTRTSLLIDMAINFSGDATGGAVFFRVTLDGAQVGKFGAYNIPVTDSCESAAMNLLATGVAAGSHTIKIQWCTDGTTLASVAGAGGGPLGSQFATLRVCESDPYV